MNTFTVLTPVDVSTGVARIGKPHIKTKRDEVVANNCANRIKQASNKVRIAEITKERILELKNAGMDYVEIALELNCGLTTIYSRLREIERG